jgi:hypothetical protein
MRRMLVSRISRRVLAEHHIALSETFAGRRGESSGGEPHVGIIYTGLNVRQSITKCTKLLRGRPHHIEDGFGEDMRHTPWPEVIVDGHVHTKFSYIREHLEYVSQLIWLLRLLHDLIARYIIFELLKNVCGWHWINFFMLISGLDPVHACCSNDSRRCYLSAPNTCYHRGRRKRCWHPDIRSRYKKFTLESIHT